MHNQTDDRLRYNDPVPSSDMAIVFADRNRNPPFFRIYPTVSPITHKKIKFQTKKCVKNTYYEEKKAINLKKKDQI